MQEYVLCAVKAMLKPVAAGQTCLSSTSSRQVLRLMCFCRHTLLDECRILLVHGTLHLLGFDHEIGAEEAIAMAEAERYVLNSLQWKVLPDALLSAGLLSRNPINEPAVGPCALCPSTAMHHIRSLARAQAFFKLLKGDLLSARCFALQRIPTSHWGAGAGSHRAGWCKSGI